MMGLIHGWMAQGVWRGERSANWLDGGAPYYRCYRCADGRDVAVGALEPQFYAQLLMGLGLQEADLPAQADQTGWPVLHKRFAEVFASKSRDTWATIFAGTDACVAPVLSLAEARDHPHLSERATYVRPGGVLQSAPAPRFSRSTPRAVAVPGAAGQDTDAILHELGYDADAIVVMRDDGVIT